MSQRRNTVAAALIALTAALLTAPAAPAEAPDITLTLVRHAQSEGNASGLIDSSVPGPNITALGRCEADAVAASLKGNDYDGIYASTMVRTQETAQPMATALREPVVVLPGLREIEAGVYEGKPEADAGSTYFNAPMQWLRGDLDARIPGSIDGNEFDGRFDEAVQSIYNSGEVNPIAYSHGGAIMTWVGMNVRGVDVAAFATAPLQNTGYFVMHGNPADGWNLVTSHIEAPACPAPAG